jgi:hypothetical protein
VASESNVDDSNAGESDAGASDAESQTPKKTNSYALDVMSDSGDRRRAIALTKKERHTGGVRALDVRSMILCGACKATGCDVCNDQGYLLDDSVVDVPLGKSPALGDVVRVEGAGDTPVSNVGRGALVVMLTSETRARRIEKKDQSLTEGQTRWLEQRAFVRRAMHSRKSRAYAAVAVLFAALAGVAMFVHFRKGKLGDTCGAPDECRSGLCVKSTRLILLGKDHLDETMKCSVECQSNDDCPSSMVCVDDMEVLDPLTGLADKSKHMNACAPR